MRRVLICLVAVVAIGLAGCASSQPGSPDVYARINAMTDCVALQHEFDQADENRAISSDPSIQTSYMKAANNRMRELGCYG